MAQNKNVKQSRPADTADKEQSYRLAKLLRAGERELNRQLNNKKTRKVR